MAKANSRKKTESRDDIGDAPDSYQTAGVNELNFFLSHRLFAKITIKLTYSLRDKRIKIGFRKQISEKTGIHITFNFGRRIILPN